MLLQALCTVDVGGVVAYTAQADDQLHSRKLTWNLHRSTSWITVPFKGHSFRFHVSLSEC